MYHKFLKTFVRAASLPYAIPKFPAPLRSGAAKSKQVCTLRPQISSRWNKTAFETKRTCKTRFSLPLRIQHRCASHFSCSEIRLGAQPPSPMSHISLSLSPSKHHVTHPRKPLVHMPTLNSNHMSLPQARHANPPRSHMNYLHTTLDTPILLTRFASTSRSTSLALALAFGTDEDFVCRERK